MDEVLRLRRVDLDWLAVDDEVVALDARSSMYLAANRSGAVLWAALKEGTTRDELVQLLVDTYRIEAETARADLDAFLGELRNRGLLDSEASKKAQ